jgi:hypothetical protein
MEMAMKREEKGVVCADSQEASGTIGGLEPCYVREPPAQSAAFSTRTVEVREYVPTRLRAGRRHRGTQIL